MSSIYKATVALDSVTGLVRDQFTNTFWFNAGLAEADAAGAAVVTDAIANFYNGGAGAYYQSISGYISAEVDRLAASGGMTIRVYDGGDGGSPLLVTEVALGGTASPVGDIALPGEVAMCLSFNANLTGVPEDVPGGAPGPIGNTHPAARKRGRVFIGPLTAEALGEVHPDVDTWQPVRPAAQFRTDVEIAGQDLMDDAGLSGAGIEWSVYSATSNTIAAVTRVSTDNAFDTQRRRGVAPTERHYLT